MAMMIRPSLAGMLFCGMVFAATLAVGRAGAIEPLSGEIPPAFAPRVASFDYVKREAMIPMPRSRSRCGRATVAISSSKRSPRQQTRAVRPPVARPLQSSSTTPNEPRLRRSWAARRCHLRNF